MTVDMLISNVMRYLHCMSVGGVGRYRSSADGKETLYASCFAVMTVHYLGLLRDLPTEVRMEWSRYILDHQDPVSGYFVGPEISQESFFGTAHSKEHLMMHLTAHVLPALRILEARPRYQLNFCERFIDPHRLNQWLDSIDWTMAWIEGNNLLFVGQFLSYLTEEFGSQDASNALNRLLDWLDDSVDRNTGVWGTDGYCDLPPAIYGAYHQLILYFYWKRNPKFSKKLVDSVLSIQHLDGGFSGCFGGGTCEDVDCVDILVNLYKRSSYRRHDIETALKKAARNVMRKMNFEGGFFYKIESDFIHMGMSSTYASVGRANMFSTWFSVHTLLLISEIVDLPYTRGLRYDFNNSCSMGWHERWQAKRRQFVGWDFPQIVLSSALFHVYFALRSLKNSSPILGYLYRQSRAAITR